MAMLLKFLCPLSAWEISHLQKEGTLLERTSVFSEVCIFHNPLSSLDSIFNNKMTLFRHKEQPGVSVLVIRT